jgi:hypothetical protein
MKILFVPYQGGPISHGIPLLALDKRLDPAEATTAFLAPREAHKMLGYAGARVLDIDHYGFRTEIQAYGEFCPDVVVDDASITTAYASALARLPRVAIQRTGMFAGGQPRNPRHRHSLGLDIQTLPDVTMLGLPQPKVLADLFHANVKIIPSIESVEPLPAHLQADPSYNYAGPLLIDDYLMTDKSALDAQAAGGAGQFESLQKFFAAHRDRKIVYATLGTVAQVTGPIRDALRHLLRNDVAVVSSIKVDDLDATSRERYFHASYLPLHFVCANVDLMIHHCGSGTYQYQLLHKLPAITIGTECYDRDDVAVRFQELGASIHLPSPREAETFFEDFKDAVASLLQSRSALRIAMERSLLRLFDEVERTASAFDFMDILEQATYPTREPVFMN